MGTRIFVVGAGWYGCHLASVLAKLGWDVRIVDRAGDFFQGSSANNQNRLHLGYHYPRSPETIAECRRGFRAFLETYPHLSAPVESNLYLLMSAEAGSQTDPATFQFLFPEAKPTNLRHTPWAPYISSSLLDSSDLSNIAFSVSERYIDPVKAAAHFRDVLGSRFVSGPPSEDPRWNTEAGIRSMFGIQATDILLNCTYNHLAPISFSEYELYLTFLYRIPGLGSNTALTVMDGPFFSIYPAKKDQAVYTVTSVVEGVVWRGTEKAEAPEEGDIKCRRKAVEAVVSNILPHFSSVAEPAGYTLSWKTKPVTTTDDRSLQWSWSPEKRTIHLYGGKITGIFEAEAVVLKCLGEIGATSCVSCV